jgi:hypothetical protein
VARVTEAAIAFREGLPVAIRDAQGTSLAAALETLSPESLAEVKGGVLLGRVLHRFAATVHNRAYFDTKAKAGHLL